MSGWSQDRLDRLKAMCKAGHSASEIARDIGVTRNAVLGKIHRLNNRKDAPAKIKTARPKSMAPDTKAELKREKLAIASRPAPPPSKPPRVIPAGEAFRPRRDGEGVALMDLRLDHCRWPLAALRETAAHFCGDPVEPGHSWCAAHKVLAYAPVQPKPRISVARDGATTKRRAEDRDPEELRL